MFVPPCANESKVYALCLATNIELYKLKPDIIQAPRISVCIHTCRVRETHPRYLLYPASFQREFGSDAVPYSTSTMQNG